ncbi:hypothetical protein F511_34945 [Dorcoceras hygrometricum]|uniref:Uncharacterized protein n=1 Tax=Dorcoceras hygrometricum TaxID=472368 RepID=A0A2Z7BT79_9LAMI|nr:hypothetical protein F511_34945 [Dorcoceras hygrometricum]
MRIRSEKRPNRKNDKKVLVAEESNKNWADSDSDSTSSSSSSSDSEPEEVHCLMADQTTTEDEVFDFSNCEFTREDPINALNEMVHEYRKLSQTFVEIKAENNGLKNSSVESSSAQLEDTNSLKTELSKLMIENDLLRNRSSELKSENERLNEVMSSWTKSSVFLSKLHETQKPLNDKSGLGFCVGESSSEGTSTQSNLAYDKFKTMNFFKASVIHNAYESVKYDEQTSGQLNQKGKAGIRYIRPENSKPSWLKNRLEKDKAKAGSKSSVPNQSRLGSKKVKSVWRPDLTKFLEVMSEKCFNAHELIEEDLLCHFRFSWKNVQLVGDLGERMSKAEIMKSLKERRADPEGTSSSLSKGKMKAAAKGGEKRKKRHHEKKNTKSARATASVGPTSEPSGAVVKAPEQQTTEAPYVLLDTSAISFVAKPFGSVSLDFVRRLVLEQDFVLVKSVPDITALEAASLHLIIEWRGRDSLQPSTGELEDIRAEKDKEKESVLLELETTRAEAQSSKAQALRFEEEKKTLQAEVERLKVEAENSWQLGKEKFLKSKDFDILCSERASVFFEKGFNGCLAQFRANGYREEEHPALFLDVEKALADMPEDEDTEEGSSCREEAVDRQSGPRPESRFLRQSALEDI